MELPTELTAVSKVFWRGTEVHGAVSSRPDDITVVTAFFDIARSNWLEAGGEQSRFRRTSDQYLEAFAHLAKLKNEMVIFVEPILAQSVLDLRRAQGLETRTSVVTIESPFEKAPLAALDALIGQRITPRLQHWVVHPERPEHRSSRYILVTALKPAFVCTAADLELIHAPQAAWIDFGYCTDDRRFDAGKPWRFDAGGKINLFHVLALDELPIYRIVRYATNYFQGGHIVGPATSWFDFAKEISLSMTSLLDADLVDDEQTLILMAWRRRPERYRIHAVSPADWRVIFLRFNTDVPLENAVVPPAPKAREESSFKEEIRIEMKRWEWRFKKAREKLKIRW